MIESIQVDVYSLYENIVPFHIETWEFLEFCMKVSCNQPPRNNEKDCDVSIPITS